MGMGQEEIDRALLSLYAQAQEVPIEDFTNLELKAIQKFIPFDSAIIAYGKKLPGGEVVPASVHLHNQPIEKWVDYQEVSHLDVSIDAALLNLGQAISYPSEKIPKTQKFSALRRYADNYEVKHALVALLPSLHTGGPAESNMHAVSLWRAFEKREYTVAEQLLFTEILPHLTRARILNHYHFLSSVQTTEELSTLMCTANGSVIAIDRGATDLLRNEWPQWFPPQLPKEILEAIYRHRSMLYQGRGFLAKARKLGRNLIITLRPTPVVANLTPAESVVAKLISRPMSYKELATHLGVTTSTIRNQLHSIYGKLNLKGKADLVAFMAGTQADKQ